MPAMRSTATATSLLDSPVRRAIVETLSLPPPLHVLPGADAATFDGRAHHTAAELAELLDLHVTTVRFHLDQLAAAGILESVFVRTGSAGRPRKVYALSPSIAESRTLSDALSDLTSPPPAGGGDAPRPADQEAMRILTGLLTESFGATEGSTPLSPQAAGRRWAENHVPATGEAPAETWGQWLGKIGQVIDVLQEWGYTPELSATTGGEGTRIDLTHCPFRALAKENPAVVCGIHKGLIAGTMAQVGEPDASVDLKAFADGDTCIAHIRPTPTERTSVSLNRGTIPVRPAAAAPQPLRPHDPRPA